MLTWPIFTSESLRALGTCSMALEWTGYKRPIQSCRDYHYHYHCQTTPQPRIVCQPDLELKGARAKSVFPGSVSIDHASRMVVGRKLLDVSSISLSRVKFWNSNCVKVYFFGWTELVLLSNVQNTFSSFQNNLLLTNKFVCLAENIVGFEGTRWAQGLGLQTWLPIVLVYHVICCGLSPGGPVAVGSHIE